MHGFHKAAVLTIATRDAPVPVPWVLLHRVLCAQARTRRSRSSAARARALGTHRRSLSRTAFRVWGQGRPNSAIALCTCGPGSLQKWTCIQVRHGQAPAHGTGFGWRVLVGREGALLKAPRWPKNRRVSVRQRISIFPVGSFSWQNSWRGCGKMRKMSDDWGKWGMVPKYLIFLPFPSNSTHFSASPGM